MEKEATKTDQNRPQNADRVDGTTKRTTPVLASAAATSGSCGMWTKVDENDLVWFFNYAEGELAPNYSFSVFEVQCAVGHCDLGHTNFSEPDETKLAAAGRSRRIRQILDALPTRTQRILQRHATPVRYIPDSVARVFGAIGLVAMYLAGTVDGDGGRELVALCEAHNALVDGNVTRIERRNTMVKLEALRRDTEGALLRAKAAFAAARSHHDGARKTPATTRMEGLRARLRGGR